MNDFILIPIFISAAIFSVWAINQIILPIFGKYKLVQEKRADKIAKELEKSFIFWERKKTLTLVIAPVVTAVVCFALFHKLWALIIGAVLGIWVPNILVTIAIKQRAKKIRSQLLDSLFILRSSLKAGLSFTQSIEGLCEEIPPPISQEFRLILKQHKLGISLEEALVDFRRRVDSEEINLLVTAILVARESGGSLPDVLTRLSETIRNNIRVKEKISTLTLQGRLQGIIMSLLPLLFVYFIYNQNPHHFDIMWQDPIGKKMLFLAVILEIVGLFLIKNISTIKMR